MLAQIVENCETRLSSLFLGPGDHFWQSYGTIVTDRATTGSGHLINPMSTWNELSKPCSKLRFEFGSSWWNRPAVLPRPILCAQKDGSGAKAE